MQIDSELLGDEKRDDGGENKRKWVMSEVKEKGGGEEDDVAI